MKLKGLTFGLLALILLLVSVGLTGCGSKETVNDFKLVKDPSFEVENYGMMVKKGNTELLEKFNEGLKIIKENGVYDEIYQKYFGNGEGKSDENKQDKNTEASDGKVYKIGTDAAYPPFEKQEGGQIVGFDVDILAAVAEEAGFQYELFHAGWDPLFDGIDKGNIDAGISAITITEDRKQLYDFSDPYFEATQLIMVPKDSTVASLADLEGKKIGVQSATTGHIAVQEAFGKTYEGIKGYEDTPAAVDDLIAGRLDAVVADNAVLQEYLKVLNNK